MTNTVQEISVSEFGSILYVIIILGGVVIVTCLFDST
jgi:hypothetical protein